MPAPKKATTKTATRKTSKTAPKKPAKTATKRATSEAPARGDTIEAAADTRLAAIIAQLKGNLAEARDVIQTTGEIMDDHRREIALTLLENIQENTDETFASLEDMVNAESLSDGLKISRDTLRSGIERNLRQVKDFADITGVAGRRSAEPVVDYVSSLRQKLRPEQTA